LFLSDKKKLSDLKGKARGKDLVDYFTADDLSELSKKFIDYGAKIVTLKCGHRGFYLKTTGRSEMAGIKGANCGAVGQWADCELWSGVYQVDKIASATGAGDASIAGFLAAFLKGKSPEIAVKCACALGAQNVTAMDAISGIKGWNYTMKMVNRREPRVKDVGLKSSKWCFDEKYGLWRKTADQRELI
jgi:sugar/nucleoside kinase (ribokinase family)